MLSPDSSLNSAKELQYFHHSNVHICVCQIQYPLAVEVQKRARKRRYQVDVELVLAAEARQVTHVENKARVRQAADGTVSACVSVNAGMFKFSSEFFICVRVRQN